jgi:small subunit ribosomal protein S9
VAEEDTTNTETTAAPSAAPSAAPPETEAEAAPAPALATIPQPDPKKHWFWGLGRRKRSVARVRIKPGDGKFIINKREIKDYFPSERDRQLVVSALEATETTKRVDVYVNVNGGGTTGQAGAILLGVGRALMTANPDYMQLLRDGGYMTRDSRKVERKKPGQPKARKRFQFSKR